MTIEDEGQTTDTGITTDSTPTDAAPPSTTDINAPGETDGSLSDGGDAPKESLDDQALKAFMVGVKEADEGKPAKVEKAAATPATKEATADASKGTAAATIPPAVAADPAKAAAADPAAKAEPDAKVEQEIKDLKLKDVAANRFRELSSTVKEQSAYIDTLKEVGIKTPEQLTAVLNDAARGLEFEEAIMRTNATPEQFSSAMQIIGGMNSGDPRLMNAVFDAMTETLTMLGQKLGREVVGNHDPLKDHPDLADAVETGQIDRARALEVVRARAMERQSAEQVRERNQQLEREQQQQVEMSNTQKRAMADIDDFSLEMEKNDPHFQAKLAMLTPMLPTIMKGMPPSRWALEVQRAYMRIPNPSAAASTQAAAQPQRVRVSHVPTRAMGAQATTMRAEPRTDLEAFMQGVADASKR